MMLLAAHCKWLGPCTPYFPLLLTSLCAALPRHYLLQELIAGPSRKPLPATTPQRTSPLPALSPEAAGRQLSQPATPQAPPSRRATPGVGNENLGQANLLVALPTTQQQQQRGRAAPGSAGATPAATAPSSPSEGRAGGSVWRPASSVRRPRSVAELHAALGSQQKSAKRTKQQSIAAFLSPPAPRLAGAASGSSIAVRQQRQPGVEGNAAAGAREAGGSSPAPAAANRQRKMPVSPRLKRLRVSFELPQLPASTGAAELATGTAAAAAATLGSAPSSSAFGSENVAAATAAASAAAPTTLEAAAAVVASRLEPSPHLAGSSAPLACSGGTAAAAGSKHSSAAAAVVLRQGSIDENRLGNMDS